MEKIQREVSGLYIFITAVSPDNWATFPLLPAGCRSSGFWRKGGILTHHHFTCRCGSQIERKKVPRDIFSSSAADSLHSVLWKEKCVLWQSPAWFPQLRNPLSSHSHGSVLHSVLTPTSRFYWLNRGINSTKTELPKTLSAVQLQQVPVTAPLVSVLWWLQGEGAHSKAALNQITWGAPRAKPALQVEKEHWTLRNVCGMFSL